MIPTTLNGYPVIAIAHRPRSDALARIVLVHREGAFHEWVVASWHPSMGDSWSWGHYFDSQAEAQTYFEHRVTGGRP